MAQIVTITNPLTGQPIQVDQLDHTAQEIDDAIDRAIPGGGVTSFKGRTGSVLPASGDYTAEMVGAYSKEETDTLLQKKVNPNLLDNWYFGNPVNQRNVSGTIDTVGYFLDRWKLVSGSVTIGSNGITLNGTIVQILETAVGTDVPASALTTEGVVVASYDNNSKTFSLTGTGQTFVAAKLELGSQQTLAHQDADGNWVLNEIPDYGEQLARCQRYFVNFNPYKMPWFAMPPAVASNTYHAYSTVTLPVAMRAQPVAAYGGKIFLSQETNHAVTSISVSDNTFTGNSIQLKYEEETGSLTANSLYRVQGGYDTSAYIWLSADL